jgi:hypothetical protein
VVWGVICGLERWNKIRGRDTRKLNKGEGKVKGKSKE